MDLNGGVLFLKPQQGNDVVSCENSGTLILLVVVALALKIYLPLKNIVFCEL